MRQRRESERRMRTAACGPTKCGQRETAAQRRQRQWPVAWSTAQPAAASAPHAPHAAGGAPARGGDGAAPAASAHGWKKAPGGGPGRAAARVAGNCAGAGGGKGAESADGATPAGRPPRHPRATRWVSHTKPSSAPSSGEPRRSGSPSPPPPTLTGSSDALRSRCASATCCARAGAPAGRERRRGQERCVRGRGRLRRRQTDDSAPPNENSAAAAVFRTWTAMNSQMVSIGRRPQQGSAAVSAACRRRRPKDAACGPDVLGGATGTPAGPARGG